MSATLVSSNTTLKVNAAVSVANGTYTAPANAYAIVNIFYISGGVAGTYTITVGTRRIWSTTTTNQQKEFLGVYVGPGQQLSASGAYTAIDISGVEFINTP